MHYLVLFSVSFSVSYLVSFSVSYLVTDLDTFLAINRWLSLDCNDELMSRLTVLESHVGFVFHRPENTTAGTRVGQQKVGVGEEELVARHRRAAHDVVHRQTIGQLAWTVDLHSVVEYEDANRSFPVQRTVDQGINGELDEGRIGYLQLAQRIELWLHLHIAQIASEEGHNGVELMQQTAFHICVAHLVAKHSTTNGIAAAKRFSR